MLIDRNAAGTHEKVVKILGDMPRGLILDAPCGEGALAERLVDNNFDVVCADIDEAYFKLKGVPFKRADLNQRLPFDDASFEYIASVEGIEHLENPFSCIREFARILKPEGSLVITTPNIMSIKSRTRFFLYSHHDFFRFIDINENFRHAHPEYTHEHINPMTFMELRYALQKARLSLIGIHTNRYVKPKRWSIFYPLIRSAVIYRTGKRSPEDKDLVSQEVLEGEILILHARKE
jgi:2-polyprenyl-3-methyl-5-hydroxy-6-metoxy-1,4-benzoquinol methylase